MKKIASFCLSALFMMPLMASCAGGNEMTDTNAVPLSQTQTITQTQTTAQEVAQMSATQQEYEAFITNLANFPVSFMYGDACYRGFNPRYFTEIRRRTVKYSNKITTTIELQRDVALMATIETSFYPEHNAYDYAVYFTNHSRENSKILSNINAVDMRFDGEQPRLKGIMGDYDYQYAEYDKDLTKESVNFLNMRGRPTHTTFPYFNLETEHGGAMLAIGWGGTWKADFEYDEGAKQTHFTGTGTVGMHTYIQPGEVVRTPLIGVVRYYERDEEKATNAWRRWLVDCVYPRDHAGTDECAQPFSTVYHAFDNDNPNRFNTDGSTAENHENWKQSVDAAYEEGLIYDVQWVDAGWYTDPYGNTVPTDWWGSVGTWELDPVKWPAGTFEERVRYAHDHGQKFIVWFEPERVTHLDGLVNNYGYDRSWALSDHGNNNAYINNLGNKACLEWTIDKVISFMSMYNIDMYREDFNIDPGVFWTIGDGYEGKDRKGITENLYVQGHYALWDAILNWAAENGKPTYLDSCASGGGRNDLETLRRSIPINRSDSDRFTTTLRLSLTPRIGKWLPYNGAVAKDAVSLTDNNCDLYTLRASYLCVYQPAANFYLDKEKVDWEIYRTGLKEWKEMNKYLLKDFYQLTEDHAPTDDTNWTSFMYFDEETDSGVIQAFRQTLCTENTCTVQVKGVQADRYYTVRDIDGKLSMPRIKGSMLQSGLRLRADEARTAIILYVEPCE